MEHKTFLEKVKKDIEAIQHKRPEATETPFPPRAPLSPVEDEPGQASASDDEVYL